MIKGKVIDILDERTLLLNVGSSTGVGLDMKFQLYEPARDVVDPDSDDVLGKLKLPKIKVKVIKLDEKFCVAETYIYKEINKGGINQSLTSVAGLFAPPNYVKEYQTFKIDEVQKRTIDKEKSFVHIGDEAEQIPESS